MPKRSTEDQQAAWAGRRLARIVGEENRKTAGRFITSRRAKGCKIATIAN